MRTCLKNFSWIFDFEAVQTHVNVVDLVNSLQTSIYLQTSAWIQPWTGLLKFAKHEPKVRKQVANDHRPERGDARERGRGASAARSVGEGDRWGANRGACACDPPKANGAGNRTWSFRGLQLEFLQESDPFSPVLSTVRLYQSIKRQSVLLRKRERERSARD